MGGRLGPYTIGYGKNTPIAIWKEKRILVHLSNWILKCSVHILVPYVPPNMYNFVHILTMLTNALLWKYIATYGSFAHYQTRTYSIKAIRRSIKWVLNLSLQNMGFKTPFQNAQSIVFIYELLNSPTLNVDQNYSWIGSIVFFHHSWPLEYDPLFER